jgi:purine-binding chemotaxis protein CheW
MDDTVQLLVFKLDRRRFGVPLEQVRRVIGAVEPTPLPQAPAVVLGVIDLQGTIVAALSVRGKFGLAPRPIALEDQFLIAQTPRRTVALLVDEAVGVVQRSKKEIVATETLVEQSAIGGITRLRDDLLLIQDMERFLSCDEEQGLDNALSQRASHGTDDCR